MQNGWRAVCLSSRIDLLSVMYIAHDVVIYSCAVLCQSLLVLLELLISSFWPVSNDSKDNGHFSWSPAPDFRSSVVRPEDQACNFVSPSGFVTSCSVFLSTLSASQIPSPVHLDVSLVGSSYPEDVVAATSS